MSGDARVLIRVDDVGDGNAAVRAFLSAAAAAGLRVTCGVVPCWLVPECRDFLVELAARHPGRVEIHQHGFQHVDHGSGRGPYKFEHSERRDRTRQLDELHTGRAVLRNAFGPFFADVLSPPFGHTDRLVRRLAVEAGFAAISGLDGERGDGVLPGFSPQVDLQRWDPPRQRGLAELEREWGLLAGEPLKGLVVHPRFLSPAAAANAAEVVRAVVGDCRTVVFADVFPATIRVAGEDPSCDSRT